MSDFLAVRDNSKFGRRLLGYYYAFYPYAPTLEVKASPNFILVWRCLEFAGAPRIKLISFSAASVEGDFNSPKWKRRATSLPSWRATPAESPKKCVRGGGRRNAPTVMAGNPADGLCGGDTAKWPPIYTHARQRA